MIPVAKPLLGREEEEAVLRVMRSGILAQGPKVKGFEDRFAEYVGTDYAVAVSSGTAALHLSMLAAGIKAGDEIITSPFSFIATANSILFCNGKPVFADIVEDTFNISPERVAERITKKTKAIIPVHLYGHPADMKPLLDLASDHNLLVVEDACQAHGAEYNRKRVGSFGIGCFSFYPTKNMTSGEGGMVTTDDKKVAETVRMLRDHGSSRKYHHPMLGFNLRMTDICAAIGLEQLKKLEGFNRKRIENAEYLSKGLKGVVTPTVRPKCRHVFNQYTIRVENRDSVTQKLTKAGVGSGVHYPVPIHKQELYLKKGFGGSFPASEKAASEVLSLPVHPALNKKDLDFIVEMVGEICG